MFITLKCPGGDGNTEMEQVASRGATSGQEPSRLRLGRRPACLQCQSRKVRCTGRTGDCDRCRAKLMTCVSPSEASSHASHHHNGSVSSKTSRTNRNSSAVEAVPESPTLSKSTSPQTTDSQAPGQMRNPASQTEALFDMDWDSDMSHLLMDIEEVSPTTSQLKATDLVSALNQRTTDSYNHDDQQYHAGSTRVDLQPWAYLLNTAQKPQTPPPSGPRPRANGLSAFALDPLVARDEPAAETVIRDQLMDDLLTSTSHAPPYPTVEPVVDPATDPAGSWAKTDGCSCMHNAVRVVQQLDDDDFHITKLSLGQVLQLQKWIIAQCYKPLDCVTCKFLPTVHTVLVIICDRLTEMFECIHKRIQKANRRISGLTDWSDESTSASSDSLSSNERVGELYCTSSHGEAGKANCNPELFSTDFLATYTTEEQVHIIRVLLKLQVRNYRALLMRVGNASQITGSEARQAKIKSMIIRLGRAASNIDSSLQALMMLFAR